MPPRSADAETENRPQPKFDLRYLTLAYDRSAQEKLGHPTAALWLLRYEFLSIVLCPRPKWLSDRLCDAIFRMAVRETADGKLALLPIARWAEEPDDG